MCQNAQYSYGFPQDLSIPRHIPWCLSDERTVFWHNHPSVTHSFHVQQSQSIGAYLLLIHCNTTVHHWCSHVSTVNIIQYILRVTCNFIRFIIGDGTCTYESTRDMKLNHSRHMQHITTTRTTAFTLSRLLPVTTTTGSYYNDNKTTTTTISHDSTYNQQRRRRGDSWRCPCHHHYDYHLYRIGWPWMDPPQLQGALLSRQSSSTQASREKLRVPRLHSRTQEATSHGNPKAMSGKWEIWEVKISTSE